jgi:anaerobic magnesium-protoporphyrin IX monomethyl ester cyclase
MLFHPLGIAQLAASLRREGLGVLAVDCTFSHEDEVLAEVLDVQPKIVGIYVMVSMSDNALALAKILRQRLADALLVCGGPLPTLRPERFARDFNVVFRGEAANAFPRFCADYVDASASKSAITRLCENAQAYPGFYCQCQSDGPTFESDSQRLDETGLNSLPLPDRSDYDHDSYQRSWTQKQMSPISSIMTSYGCPCSCDFCSKPIFGNLFRRRDLDRIMEEIRDIKRWGYTELWIGDDCFTLDMEHVRGFCTRLICEELDIRWTCLSRADKISADEVELMRAAGCDKVYFGLESGSNEVLKLMKKETTVEGAERTVRLFSRSGIRTAGFFIVGYPGETYETIERTFAWALSLPLDEISFTVPYPLPGTGLFEKVQEVQAGADWKHENENRFVYQSDFDQEYLKQRIEETYAQFESNRKAVAHL